MRKYLAVANLKNAAILGIAVGLMALPRILEGKDRLVLVRMIAVFPSMIIVAGAVTAWGNRAGMCGPFPDKARTRAGTCIALVAGLLIAPFLFWQDAGTADLLSKTAFLSELHLPFPSTLTACLALILWSAGFETLFFRAGTMSLLTRVTNRQWIAIAGAVLLRLSVNVLKIGQVDMDAMMILELAGMIVVTTVGCILYARAGLPAAMTFAATIDARHLVRWLMVDA